MNVPTRSERNKQENRKNNSYKLASLNSSEISSEDNSLRGIDVPWFVIFDWAKLGYWLFLAGSIIYFAQALIVYYQPKQNDDSSESSNNTYDDDGYDPPYYSKNVSGWESVASGIIFLVESLIYNVGWYLNYSYIHNLNEADVWYKDWNFHGNLWFLIGSIGYLVTAIFELELKHSKQAKILDLVIAIIFIFDSFFYLFALFSGAHSRSSGSKDLIKNRNKCIHIEIDVYLLASIFYIFGSFVYFAAAIQDIRNVNSSTTYMLGAVIFIIDSILYLLSSYQNRSDEETTVFDRSNKFYLEKKQSSK